MAEIQVEENIAPGDFADRFEHRDLPVVLKGAARSIRAVDSWTPEHLTATLGHVEIRFKVSSSASHPDFHRSTLGEMFARQSGTFGEFLRHVTSGPPAERARWLFTGDEQFLLQRRDGKTMVNEALRPLLDDVPLPSIVPEGRLYTVWAWFSGRGVRTWLHYDNNGCHNVNVQVTGEKRCRLYAPSELSRLFPFPLGGPNPAHNCSQVDVDAVDLDKFAAFADVPFFEAHLEPGDMLFIPAFWFHTFVHDGAFNSNVNFWWKPERPALNPVAIRQALLDLAAASGGDLAETTTARALFRRLDDAAVDPGCLSRPARVV